MFLLKNVRGTEFVIASPAFQLERQQRIEICIGAESLMESHLRLAVDEVTYDDSLPIFDDIHGSTKQQPAGEQSRIPQGLAARKQ